MRDLIPKPMQPPARAVYRSLRYVKRSLSRREIPAPTPLTAAPQPPSAEELDRRHLDDPPPRPDWGHLPCFPRFGLTVAEFQRACPRDRLQQERTHVSQTEHEFVEEKPIWPED